VNDHVTKEPKFESRKLDQLVAFPSQDYQFPPCSAEDDARLLESIQANGLRVPIEILPANAAGYPANTIVFGHRRCKALIQLGITEVNVLVRYDLADSGAGEIEALFIHDNLDRRQLPKLGKARAIMRLFEIERSRAPGELRKREEREARDRVGKAIGMSGRNAQRYLNILKSPISVQTAFESEFLTLTEAGRIASLPETVQHSIDESLKSGEDAQKIARRFLGRGRAKRRGPAVNRFIAGIERASRELEGIDLTDISILPMKKEIELVCRVNKYCNEIVRAYNRTMKERRAALDEIKDRRRT